MSVEVEVGGVYEQASDLTPAGTIVAFGGTNAPAGWYLCDGTVKNRNTDSRLFDVIGTNFGEGDGNQTFNLPDFRGIFLRGAGDHGTMVKANGSHYSGGNLATKQNDIMQQITGFLKVVVKTVGSSGVFSHGSSFDTSVYDSSSNGNQYQYNFDSANSEAEGGARTGDETAPASLSVNYIIKN